MKNTLQILGITLLLTGCVSGLLTENTLEGMSTKQIEQGYKSASNSPWWFDNKKVAKILKKELAHRGALDRVAEKELAQ